MACFLLLILLLCFCAYWELAESTRLYPETPFPIYCTVDPITGVCQYPKPVPNCPFIDKIRGRCSSLPLVAPPLSIALPPILGPTPAPEVYDSPPLTVPLGPQVIILTPPAELTPESPPVYGTPIDFPMPPQLPLPLPPSGAAAAMPPDFVGLPVDFPIPNQPPFPMPLEPAPGILSPAEAPGLLPAEPPAVSELPINIPTPP